MGRHVVKAINSLAVREGFAIDLLGMLERNADAGEFRQMLREAEESAGDSGQCCLLIDSIKAAISVREAHALQTRREKGLVAVLETAQDLTALRDPELVLLAIVRRARQLLTADIGYLASYDPARDDFHIHATDGAISERFKRIRVARNTGVCGRVLHHKTPYHSNGYLSDPAFAHDPDIDIAVSDEGVRSLLGAPLTVGSDVIGVLCVCERQKRSYAQWEISMLSALAAQACVAIENARLFRDAQLALQQASQANDLLHRQACEEKSAAEVQERLTRLVAKGADAAEIVKVLSEVLNGDLLLLDAGEEPVHRASQGQTLAPDGSEALNVKASGIQDALHTAIRQSHMRGCSQIASTGAPGYVRVSAVHGANRLLGALALETREDLTEVQARTFERAALVMGVVLLSQDRNELNASKEVTSALRALLFRQQDGAASPTPVLLKNGIDLAAGVRVAVLEVRGCHPEFAVRRLSGRLGMLIEECDGVLVALACASKWDEHRAALERLRSIDRRIELLGVWSNSVDMPSKLPDLFQALRRGIGILTVLGHRDTLVEESALSIYSLLFDQAQANDLAHFIESQIHELIAYDERKRGELCSTMLVYLDHMQNVRQSAERLGVHVNTLRQRLDTIGDLLGDWHHHGRCLEIHMALRLQALRSKVQC